MRTEWQEDVHCGFMSFIDPLKFVSSPPSVNILPCRHKHEVGVGSESGDVFRMDPGGG